MTAHAPSSPTVPPPSPAAPAGRARPWFQLDTHEAARLEDLVRRVGESHYLGRGQESESRLFFVDLVGADDEPERFTGETWHLAIGRALRARGGGQP